MGKGKQRGETIFQIGNSEAKPKLAKNGDCNGKNGWWPSVIEKGNMDEKQGKNNDSPV